MVTRDAAARSCLWTLQGAERGAGWRGPQDHLVPDGRGLKVVIDGVVRRYKKYLLSVGKPLHRNFCSREEFDPESAHAEAIMFLGIREEVGDGHVNEHAVDGGPDFAFRSARGSFLLEVSSLRGKTVADASGIPLDPMQSPSSFKPISSKLYTKVISKQRQAESAECPLVLAITTEHYAGSTLMGERAARQLLTGRDYLTFIPNDTSTPVRQTTRLEDSVFFQFDSENTVGTYRTDISAIMLVHIAGNTFRAVGVLNPKAKRPFDYLSLPGVRFLGIPESLAPDSFSISPEWKSVGRPGYKVVEDDAD
jgi:hypothetical protein